MFDVSRIKKFAATSNAPQVQYIDMPIDHFSSKTKATYKNRYWFNDTHYEPNGPVFVYDTGEGNAEPYVPVLEEAFMRSSVMQLAKKYKGIGVLWEHRYYGESVPFIGGNTSKSLQGDQWQYLTVEQALEDVVYFSNRFSTSKANAGTLSPSKTPWIFLGGSYPGIRAALLRIRNPDVIYASWASSAPVQAQVDMSSYWGVVERALPRNCSNDFVAMASYANDIFSKNDTTEARFKQALYSAYTVGKDNLTSDEAAELLDVDAAYYLLDPLSGWQNRGLPSAEPMCNFLETANYTQTAPANGIFSTEKTSDAVEDYLTTISAYTDSSSSEPSDASHIATKTLRIAHPAEGSGNTSPGLDQDDLAWTYQYCSQFGFYQAANPNNSRSIQANAISIPYFQAWCDRTFPKGVIPSSPAVEQVNKFGGWKMNPSRVMFTNGEVDPWRSLSVASEESNSPQRKPNKTIPAASGHFDTNTYFGLVYPKQVHVPDMSSTPNDNPGEIAAFEQGLALFTSALDVWLPVFNTSRDTSSNSTKTNSGSNANNGRNGALRMQTPYYSIPLLIVVAFLTSMI